MTENSYPRFKNTRYYEIFWASPTAICQKTKNKKQIHDSRIGEFID